MATTKAFGGNGKDVLWGFSGNDTLFGGDDNEYSSWATMALI